MPFGPINDPVIFIVFIHDVDATWKGVAAARGVFIDEKLVLGSSLMKSTAGLVLLRSLLSILNSNRISAYLKISHFLLRNASSV